MSTNSLVKPLWIDLNIRRHIFPSIALFSNRLLLCCSLCAMDQMGLEPQDIELLESFQQLSPLLQAASAYHRATDEEPQSKKSRHVAPEEPGNQVAPTPQQAVLTLTKLLTQVVLQHERQLQAIHRQDSFVFFAQLNKQGCVPLLAQKTTEWKDQVQSTTPTPSSRQTLRTYLLHALIQELQARVLKLSQSKPGEQLWDTAVSSKMIHADGSWPFQRWNREQQALETSHRPALQMPQVLRELEHLLELLRDNDHVVRFHALRPQQQVVPWLLQLHLRQDDLWRILQRWAQNSIWGMLGVSMKEHSQKLGKTAEVLQTMTQAQKSNKGHSKGQSKGKHIKRQQ